MEIIGKNHEGTYGHGRNDIERMGPGFVPVEENSIPLGNSCDTSNDQMIPKIECWRSLLHGRTNSSVHSFHSLTLFISS
jgi:hypothetical protein